MTSLAGSVTDGVSVEKLPPGPLCRQRTVCRMTKVTNR